MDAKTAASARALIRTTALLQLKLLLSAARDLVLTPLVLGAALFDLVLLKQHGHEPKWLRTVLGLGARSDEWIDVWSGARDAHAPPRENVDRLMARIEDVVRDPQSGARRARVLKRWAERQVGRARRAGLPPAAPADDAAPR